MGKRRFRVISYEVAFRRLMARPRQRDAIIATDCDYRNSQNVGSGPEASLRDSQCHPTTPEKA